MPEQNSTRSSMPDVAKSSTSQYVGTLNRVGMSKVEIPVMLPGLNGKPQIQPAKGDFYVSLDSENVKGIHMSRLFIAANEMLSTEVLSFDLLHRLMERFLGSHVNLSSRASTSLEFDYMSLRPSLLSDNTGWRYYPMTFSGLRKKDQNFFELKIRITYSSTCPCSAALARQLIQENFSQYFQNKELNFDEISDWLLSEDGINATPHSQRSYADIILRSIDPNLGSDLNSLIDTLEDALQTPVQAAVKRVDEQEFAKLNGKNLMFCEDAARHLKMAVESLPNITDYRIEARHLESLHPHDAVAIVTKGIVNGLQP